MKRKIFILILSIALTGNAQDLSQWQVGFNVNPFLFNRIEKSNILQKSKQDFPNGFGFGLTIEKNWNEKFGIKTGIEYCTQNQKYEFFYNDSRTITTKIDATVSYYKIPITVQYSLPLNNKLFLTFNQGIQYSSLHKFEVFEYERIEINKATRSDEVFNKNLFGIIGSVGIKGILSERFTYSTNLRYEYDFTKAENNTQLHSLQYIESGTDPANNFRLGLELGVQYHFSMNHIRFNKNPK